jgi:hypothetical protein
MLLFVFSGAAPGAIQPVQAAPGITRVSVDSSGAEANGGSTKPAVSDDGRYVAFQSSASNLVSEDTNNVDDIFVHDRQTGATTRVSVRSNGAQANDGASSPAISGDGLFVAFYSEASNLLNGDTNGFADIFVHDRQTGQTTRVSVDSIGNEANAPPPHDYAVVSISGDGRFVAFYSDASNLVGGDTNNETDIFVHDRQTGRTIRASIASDGTEANAGSGYPNLSGDGRYVTFSSGATNLVAGDTNGKTDVFVRDLQAGTTTRVSVNSRGEQADIGGHDSDISGDGRFIVFLSSSNNLDPREEDVASKDLVYVHDRQGGQTTLASVYSEGWVLEVGIVDQPVISRDGRYVAFDFHSHGAIWGAIVVRDLLTGTSIAHGNDSSGWPALAADGNVIVFADGASNLVSGDTNDVSDIFVKEVSYGPDRNPTVYSVTPDCGFSPWPCPYPTPSSVSFLVLFTEQVTGVTADDFSLTMLEGVSGASITGVSGYGSQYFVTVDTGSGDGKLRVNVLDNDSIKDSTRNPLGGPGAGNGGFTRGRLYWIEKNNPAVTGIVRADPNPTAAAEVHFTVNFSEPVWPVRLSDFVLSTTGGISGAAVTAISPREDQYRSAMLYTVTVNTGTGNGTLRLDLVDDDSILDWNSNPLGGPGLGNGNFTAGQAYKKVSTTAVTFRSNGRNDGWVLESGETSNRGGSLNAKTTTFVLGDDKSDRQYRAILDFPTAALPDNAVITRARLMVKLAGVTGANPFLTHGNILVDIRSGAFGYSGQLPVRGLQKSDFQSPSSMDSAGMIENNPLNGWYWTWLDVNSLRFIDLNGFTQFRLRFQSDDNDDLASDHLRFYSGDYENQANRPRLVIEYYIPK